MKDETKRKVFYTYSEITARQDMGAYWLARIQTYFNPYAILSLSAWVKILFPDMNKWILIIGAALLMFSIEFIKYFIGKFSEVTGIWKKISEYNTKKDHVNPFNTEVRATLEEICKKMGIQHHFKDI